MGMGQSGPMAPRPIIRATGRPISPKDYGLIDTIKNLTLLEKDEMQDFSWSLRNSDASLSFTSCMMSIWSLCTQRPERVYICGGVNKDRRLLCCVPLASEYKRFGRT
jgi:hypothetical protein